MREMLLALSFTSLSACAQDTVNFKQIYVGFDGPSAPSTFVYTSLEAASSSWLAQALANQTQSILSQVDFNHQALVAAAVGERSTTTGNVSIALVVVHQSIVEPYVRIGVNEPSCKLERAHSYPFVLAVIEKPEGVRPVSGYDHQNFPDGCKPVPNGVAHNAQQP